MINSDLSKFANKKFGQNFLKDDFYLKQIIQSMPKNKLKVVEIGPGLGDLTKELLISGNDVIAFEVDKRLCEHLNSTLESFKNNDCFKLRCGDVLDNWENESLIDEPYHLVANLPYYIATHIILKALRDKMCQSILVMVQKEVADKFSAKPKQKEFSALGVLASSVGEAINCFNVPPTAFVPPPKITSAVLKITKNSSLDDNNFEEFLKVAFSQPRKKLIKNLSLLEDIKKLEDKFEKFGLDLNTRPHEVETKQYIQLYETLKEIKHERKQRKKRTNEPESS
ncbi:MAG: 16S rRNA (adenine(1518)-N(6)/adenine(1519)-N(6))-dimethyltransferase RsmA [Sulfurovaceae bacterium]|jgi:16S rRNA (adenine1518-N6/adenine1519-N6)-dimethyltransferase|nr:16S rRNA (adenine(1518)-N(6)/adenine(1519)-N(6))-dimethyltransferase RsmA [Sulfurovaceae bacterium]MDD5548111.1 16S rRNA (adenine(1518)-N(6)/adenine(1519)-N(6))-dimethyltransferase RsmA [Sulfurovaceae bacterium]